MEKYEFEWIEETKYGTRKGKITVKAENYFKAAEKAIHRLRTIYGFHNAYLWGR